MFSIAQLKAMVVPELKDLANKMDLKSYQKMKKMDLVLAILDQQAVTGTSSAAEPPFASDPMGEARLGYGGLRDARHRYHRRGEQPSGRVG